MHDATFVPIEAGRVIAERYRLEAPIGQGAMGSVWRAQHLHLDAPVAIKLVGASLAGAPEMLERFLREARSAAAVRSSHVVQIFDYGVDGGQPYIAMELLVGEALDQRLAARGSLPGAELDKIFSEVARAVGNAHELGVVHRDIKPANIFLAREGGHEVTKVLDFGIAKLTAEQLGGRAGSSTHTGIILGTPRYMSPEQARGKREVDHRADLWSLAVLAFECLTGRQPFESTTLGGLVVEICTAEPRVPSSVARVPAGFDAWFARGVSKAPEARFQSAREMAEQLHALLAAEGLAAESRPRSSVERQRTAEPRERVSVPARPGPALAPAEVSRTEMLPAPGRAAAAPSEPSVTTAGPVSTEVLRPGTSARRWGLLLALALAAAMAVGLGPGRALWRSAPSAAPLAAGATPVLAGSSAATAGTAGPAGSITSGTAAGPTAPAETRPGTPAAGAPAERAAASDQPPPTVPSPERGPSAPVAKATSAPPSSRGGAIDAAERARSSKLGAKRRAAKARPSADERSSPSPPPAPPSPNSTPPAFDPYSDRL